MVAQLTSNIKSMIQWEWIETDSDGTELARDANVLLMQEQLLDGTGTNQADLIWHQFRRNLAASSSETFDLQALLMNLFQDSIQLNMVKVHAVMIVSHSPGPDTLTVGDSGVNQWFAPFGATAGKIVIPGGGHWSASDVVNGWDVDATHKDLKINNDSLNQITYSIAILGDSS